MGLFDGMLLNTETPTKVLLKHPNGSAMKDKNGKQGYICVLSTDSKRANELRQQARDRRLSGDKMSAAVLDEESIDLLAKLTGPDWYLVGFDGNELLGDDQKPIPCTAENAKVLYSIESAAHWTDQVKEGAGMRERFTPGLAKP